MWMKDPNSNALVAVLLGPCDFNTYVDGVSVSIREETMYPFSDNIQFTVNPLKDISFPLVVRKPFGCAMKHINVPENATVTEENQQVIIIHKWSKEDVVHITFDFEINL